MLIDQNKYIDGDPLGHACWNDAMYHDGNYFYCEECKNKIEAGDKSVTRPVFPIADMYSVMDEIKKAPM